MIIKSTDGVGPFSGVGRAGCAPSGRGGSGRVKSAESFDGILRGKTDTVEISRRAPSCGGSGLKETKAGVLGEIGRDADPAALESLKGLVASGGYRVDPDELARILSE